MEKLVIHQTEIFSSLYNRDKGGSTLIKVDSSAAYSFIPRIGIGRPKIIHFVKNKRFFEAHKEFLSVIGVKGREQTFYLSPTVLDLISVSSIESAFLLWLVSELEKINPSFVTLFELAQQQYYYSSYSYSYSYELLISYFVKILRRKRKIPFFSIQKTQKNEIVIEHPPEWILVRLSDYFATIWRFCTQFIPKIAPIFPKTARFKYFHEFNARDMWAITSLLDYLSNDQKKIKKRAQLFIDLLSLVSEIYSASTTNVYNIIHLLLPHLHSLKV